MGILERLFGVNREKDDAQDARLGALETAGAALAARIATLEASGPAVDAEARAAAAALATRVQAIEDDIAAAGRVALPPVA